MKSGSKRSWQWTLHALVLREDHEAILAACGAARVRSVEMHPLHVEGLSIAELEALRERYREAGIRVDSFHLPFTGQDDLSSLYETERRRSVERIRFWLECLPALGVRVGIFHPGASGYSVEVEGLDRFMAQLKRSLDTLLPVAEAHGVQLALENMPPMPGGTRFGSVPEHFTLFAEAFAHSHFGFCLDTGHALMAGGLAWAGPFFDAMGSRLIALHLADNPGNRDSHLPPGHGRVDWGEVFPRLADMGFSHGACVESAPFAPGPPYGPEEWQHMFDDLEALVAQSLER